MATSTNLPSSLKPIQNFLSVSKQFSKRDPIVSYYCQMYAMQQGIKLAKGDEVAKSILLKMMSDIEALKRELKDEDAIKDDVIAQTHIEEVALRLFDQADIKDRNAQFDKGMVKLFFVSSHLFTILNQFGDISDEIEQKRKYAKWKAVEIDKCLKNGITPTPGPPGGIEDDDDDELSTITTTNTIPPPNYGFNVSDATPPYPGAQPVFPGQQDTPAVKPTPLPRKNVPSPSSSHNPPPTQPATVLPPPAATGTAVNLSGLQKDQVQKYCKYAVSCLDFNDTPGAIDFLEKSLKLLRTGKET